MSTTNKIPTRQLGRNGPIVGSIGFGTMAIGAWYGPTDKDEAFKAIAYAADRGATFFDCADIYGDAEATLGEWFTVTGRRKDIFLATKFGAFEVGKDVAGLPMANSKPSYIKRAVERSLTQLKTDYIDLYYQHRVDREVPIEVVLETLRPFVESGKIKWLGLSNCSIETLRRAKAVKGVGEKLIAVQMEFSPFELSIEVNGFAAAARELGVAVVAYSPLGRGMISGRYRSRADFASDDLRLAFPRFSEENFSKNLELVTQLEFFADKYKVTTSQITLAWILAEHDNFVPIPGSRTIARVEENISSSELKLAPEDVAAIRKVCEEADVQGLCLPEVFLKTGAVDSLPLDQWKGE